MCGVLQKVFRSSPNGRGYYYDTFIQNSWRKLGLCQCVLPSRVQQKLRLINQLSLLGNQYYESKGHKNASRIYHLVALCHWCQAIAQDVFLNKNNQQCLVFKIREAKPNAACEMPGTVTFMEQGLRKCY